jgi:hypothetical protein
MIPQMFAITAVLAGIKKPLYTSGSAVQWNKPKGEAGAHRKTSFSMDPTYGKAAWSLRVGSRCSDAKKPSTSA